MSFVQSNHRLLPVVEEVAPADQAGVAAAIRRAYENAVPVYPVGGGTMLWRGGRPQQPGLALNLNCLDRLVVHAADDLTITVEAGMTLAQLAAYLAARRQCLPVDVPFASRATVGGWIMTNVAGPRRFRHGTAGDYLLGFRAVDGTGMAFAGGAKVVKNAAGYNMPRLLVGSLGTLAVLTEATLQVRPLPEASALVICELAGLDGAESLIASLVQSPSEPIALELAVGSPWSTCAPFAAKAAGHERCAWLVVGLEGSSAEVQWMIGQVQQELKDQPGKPIVHRVEFDAVDDTLRVLAEAVWQPAACGGEQYWIAESHVLSSSVVEVVDRLWQRWPGSMIASRAGDGIVVARIPADERSQPGLFRQELQPVLLRDGGWLAVHSAGPAAGPTASEAWGGPPPGASLMTELKRRFDPKGILNPGRLLFAD